MHVIRGRPICRAKNTFSPSIALWQHFVAPSQYLSQPPPASSFATEAARSRDDGGVDSTQDESRANPSKPPIHYVRFSQKKRTSKGVPAAKPHGNGPDGNTYPGSRGENGQDVAELLKSTYDAYDLGQDYAGVVVKPMASAPIKESAYPWVPSVPERSGLSAEKRLNLEIHKFHQHVRPSQTEAIARKHLVEQVREHVRELLPNHVLEVFGSERTGIAFAGSDIDLRLVPEAVLTDTARSPMPPTPSDRALRRENLRKLYWHLLRRHRQHYLLPTLRWARYPLISLQDKASGLDVQVVLSNDTSISREYMQRYIQQYPYLPEVYSVIKCSLDIRGLTDVFRGGIGSYSLFMMTVASLKHRPHPDNNAAGALVNFLRFWSRHKSDAYGISIEPPETFAKTEQVVMHEKTVGRLAEGKNKALPLWMPTIRDPADETNDLGRKTVAWKHVRATLDAMHRTLRTAMVSKNSVSILAGLVGPVYRLRQKHRTKLAEYGRSLSQAARQYADVDYHPQKKKNQGAGAQPSSIADLAALAKAIRNGDIVENQSARETEATDSSKGEADDVNPWLKDITATSVHKKTGEALSNLLRLDEKPKVD